MERISLMPVRRFDLLGTLLGALLGALSALGPTAGGASWRGCDRFWQQSTNDVCWFKLNVIGRQVLLQVQRMVTQSSKSRLLVGT